MPRVKLPSSGPCLLIAVLLFSSVGFAQTATILRGTNVRKTPNTTSAILETLHQGDSVTLRSTRKRTGYYHVTASDGTVGWVLAKNISTSATSTGSGMKAGNKIGIACPAAIAGAEATITDCPDTGCGPSLDPNLNKQKNIAIDNDAPVDKVFSFLAPLPDPVPGFAIGNTREKLITLGEGQMIRVVALALKARVGGKESCNCGLAKPADTDNHIVLVDPSVTNPTLAKDETTSQTAEFTPRVRLTHSKLVGMDLQALIAATPNQALLVRVTGVQMFDSEHSLGPFHLKRKNNWEIHPVFGLEYCPTDKKCTQESDANWVDMEK
jgi:uncharacterized protein YgiM (DUF1202 family)